MIVYLLIFMASPLLLWPVGLALGRWLDGRWTKVYWIFGLLLVAVNFRVWNSPPSEGDRFGLGALFAFWFTFASIVFLTASTWSRLPADPAPPAMGDGAFTLPGRRGWRFDASDIAFGLLAGGVFPLVFFVWFAVLARGPGLPVAVVLAVLAVIMLALAATGRRQPTYINTFCLIFSMTLSGLMIQGYADIRTVAHSARSAAAGAHYCIQSGRRPIVSFYDLSRLTLREPSTPNGYMRYHALLVISDGVRQTILNWSYKKRSFVNDISSLRFAGNAPPEIVCVPAADGGLPPVS